MLYTKSQKYTFQIELWPLSLKETVFKLFEFLSYFCMLAVPYFHNNISYTYFLVLPLVVVCQPGNVITICAEQLLRQTLLAT